MGKYTTWRIQSISGMEPCNHEEADTRIMVHVADCVKRGYNNTGKITIRTTDTDVVVLAVSIVCLIAVTELWIDFGTAKSFRYIGAHTISSNIGPQKAKALPMFHSLTGCDTVSSFAGHGKKSCWDVWKSFPQLTDTYLILPIPPSKCMLMILVQFKDLLCYCISGHVSRTRLTMHGNSSLARFKNG